MAYPSYTDTNLNPLVLNYVPDPETFDQMTTDNQINDNEVYLVQEEEEKEIFYATYNETTYEEVVEAYESGKDIIVICHYDDNKDMRCSLIGIYQMPNKSSSYSFAWMSYTVGYFVFVQLRPDNGWQVVSEHYLSSVSTNDINNNAVTTTKIADNAITTDKINNNAVTTAKIADKNRLIWYGICNTAADATTKSVTIGDIAELTNGLTIQVMFVYSLSVSTNPIKLRLNNFLAYPIKVTKNNYIAYGTTNQEWIAGSILTLVFTGDAWIIVDGAHATTTSYGKTKLNSAINSTSTSEAATPSAVKQAYDLANSKAPTASPNFTGTPTAPTAAAGTNTTQLATTAFVTSALNGASLNIAGSTVALGGEINSTTLLSNLGLSTAMHFIGKATVAITDNSTTNPNISGYDFASDRKPGDVIIDSNSDAEYVWTIDGAWEKLGSDSSFKLLQSAVTDPTASGSSSAFIDSISQNAQGVITVTKKTVALANNFTVSFNGGTVEGTGKYTFNGSAPKSVNIKSGTGIEIAAAANEITIANAGVLSVKGAAESSYRAGNVSINGANILGSNAIGNNSTPVYWNGSAFVNATDVAKGSSLFKANSSSGYYDGSYDYWWNLTIDRIGLMKYSNAPGSSGRLEQIYVPSIEGAYVALTLPKSNGTLALTDSPNFTGTPTAPTAAAGTNNTQIATTAFVQAAINAAITAALGASY